MLRFFRQIRKKLIEQENIRKYIWYALGEILLVMIGILLALQVNNWNEVRKDQQFLNFALSELYSDLSQDMRLIYEGIEPRLSAKESAIDSMFQLITLNEPVSEEIFFEQYINIDYGFSFTPIFGSYETLSRQGLDKIDNQDLRKSIIDFYEYYLPRVTVFIHENEDYLFETNSIKESEFLNLLVKDYEDRTPFVGRQLIDYQNIYSNQAFLKILDLQHQDAVEKRKRLNSIIPRYEALMKKLEKELDGRNLTYTRFNLSKMNPDF